MHQIYSRSQDNSDSMLWPSKLCSVGDSHRILLSHLHQSVGGWSQRWSEMVRGMQTRRTRRTMTISFGPPHWQHSVAIPTVFFNEDHVEEILFPHGQVLWRKKEEYWFPLIHNFIHMLVSTTVSTSNTIHTCSKNIWPCSSNSISPPSWDAKSWCGWSWKWWRVFKTKDAVFFIVIQGPCTCGASSLSSRCSQFFVVFSMMSSLWCVSWTRTPLLDWTWFGSGLTSFFFFFWLYILPSTGKNKAK